MIKNKQTHYKNNEEDNSAFTDYIVSTSEGKDILSCIQCGTCSATCPVNEIMDYYPRQIFALIRNGMKDKVLSSLTPWICASCYRCTVNCPATIKITEVMYQLKRMSIKSHMVSKNTDAGRFYNIFLSQISNYGRAYELGLMIKYMMFHHPVDLLKQIPRGISMIKDGSISLLPHRIKDAKALRRITEYANELDKSNMS